MDHTTTSFYDFLVADDIANSSTTDSAASSCIASATEPEITTASEAHSSTEPAHNSTNHAHQILLAHSQGEYGAQSKELLTWSFAALAKYHNLQNRFESTTFTILDCPPLWRSIQFWAYLIVSLGLVMTIICDPKKALVLLDPLPGQPQQLQCHQDVRCAYIAA
jgi:hypothetical protein